MAPVGLRGEGEHGALTLPTLLPPGTTLRILSDGRAGHEAQTLAISEALGLAPDIRTIAPGKLFVALAPFGPADPFDRHPTARPYPDIVLAAGRRTIPYLRRIKAASKRRVFTVYVNNPGTLGRAADLVVAPMHDGLFGRTVVNPLAPANRVTAQRLARLRDAPDPRLAALPRPRVAFLIGGDSRHFAYTAIDADALANAARVFLRAGCSVMATGSRRTPLFVMESLRKALDGAPAFVWDGGGDNPYFSMLALADHILVTADSVNMVGEAAATGAPVHVFAPSGGHRRIAAFLASMQTYGAARPWTGQIESWSYTPLHCAPMIATALARAYGIYRGLPM